MFSGFSLPGMLTFAANMVNKETQERDAPMSSDTTPDKPQPKAAPFPPARDAAGFRALLTLMLLAAATLTTGLWIGHAVAPAAIGAPPPGLLRLTFYAAVAWLAFNAAWALINHLISVAVHGLIHGYALVVTHMLTAAAAYAQAQAEAQAPSPAPNAPAPTSPETTVTYMTDFLKERLEALKNQNPSGDA